MKASRRVRPDAMRHVPLLGMASDESLELAQHLLGGANLVRPIVAGVLGEDQWSGLRLVGIVGQPVDADRKDGRPGPQRDRGRAEWDRRQPAGEWDRVDGGDE